MTRRDYINDVNAPKINSVVPSVVAIVRDPSGLILMIHKTDNDKWALPGGGHDLGESISETVVREVFEETGFTVEVDELTGIYTNPRHVMAYDDGEVRQQFSIAFLAHVVGGKARTSSESDVVEWLSREEVGQRNVHPSMLQRIDDAVNFQGSATIR
ncbi:NUDIX hydrolase [Janibacter sp. Soil728]|uniref:NUDIX hydrolase n=1 Tax=Janibacter sp. Soil728 TaxID=1736393 RepID=UPI0009E7A874|nr:NUDIX domain-containing protein [Janibacter sp. Soil728]